MAIPSSDPIEETTTEDVTEMTQPILVDLGKQSSRKIKDLAEGEGELWDEVLEVIEEVKDMLGEEANGKLILPLIMVYQKKSRRPRIEKLFFPLADWNDDDDDEEDDD